MDRARTPFLYEDLERHRQPSIYYLNSADNNQGPHLIFDWNGPPTDFDEFGMDIMSDLILAQHKYTDPGCQINHDIDSCEEPKIFHGMVSEHSPNSHLIATDDDNSIGLFTVPPVAKSLFRRQFQNQLKKRPIPIPEETSVSSTKHLDANKIKKIIDHPKKKKRPN